MKKIYLILMGFLILELLILGTILLTNKPKEDTEKYQYQGPVRPTDDEQYFRDTGITRPLQKQNGEGGKN